MSSSSRFWYFPTTNASTISMRTCWQAPLRTFFGGNARARFASGHAFHGRLTNVPISGFINSVNFSPISSGFSTLNAWFVRLLKKGHQTEHIHHAGWLSGVLYLQVPKFSDQEGGCIEFGLWGYDYPVLNKNYPRKRYYPKNGDIILFPSSLFHRTIPFHSNEERMSIAFDLIPTWTWQDFQSLWGRWLLWLICIDTRD